MNSERNYLVVLQKEYANRETSADRREYLSKQIAKLLTTQYGSSLPVKSSLKIPTFKPKQIKLTKLEKRMEKAKAKAKVKQPVQADEPEQEATEMLTPIKEKRNAEGKLTMTLFEAKQRAKELSKRDKDKKVFVIVGVESGDCGVSYSAPIANCETIHAYKNGSEVALPTEQFTKEAKAEAKLAKKQSAKENKSLTKNQKNMKTTTKKSATPAKKTAKTAVKKTAAKSENREPVKGKKQVLTVKEIVALLRKGVKVSNAGGKQLPLMLGYMQAVADQTKEKEVIVLA